MVKKFARNLKTFIKSGKRFRVVYSTPDWEKAKKVVPIYRTERKYATVYFDKITNRYLVGVRKRGV